MILEDLLELDRRALLDVMHQGHPLEPEALVGHAYLGVELVLPWAVRQLLWTTFRKTFVDDGAGGVRGWNVRMEQHGVRGRRRPLTDGRGRQQTFGHYRVARADGISWPHGWSGTHFLDYGSAGNLRRDPARLGHTPLVAVNDGDMHLLLGWEVIRIGPVLTTTPSIWALEREGPVDAVVQPPRTPSRRPPPRVAAALL